MKKEFQPAGESKSFSSYFFNISVKLSKLGFLKKFCSSYSLRTKVLI